MYSTSTSRWGMMMIAPAAVKPAARSARSFYNHKNAGKPDVATVVHPHPHLTPTRVHFSACTVTGSSVLERASRRGR